LIEEARRGVKSRVIRYDGFVIVDSNSILFPNLEACEEVFVFSMRVSRVSICGMQRMAAHARFHPKTPLLSQCKYMLPFKHLNLSIRATKPIEGRKRTIHNRGKHNITPGHSEKTCRLAAMSLPGVYRAGAMRYCRRL
jgi:hypothetical protein